MYQLDLRGLGCPMPLLKLKKYLAETADSNAPFEVQVSDRGALKDIPAFCAHKGLAFELVCETPQIVFCIGGERRDSSA